MEAPTTTASFHRHDRHRHGGQQHVTATHDAPGKDGFQSHHPQEQHRGHEQQRQPQEGAPGGERGGRIYHHDPRRHRPTPMERAYASHLLRTHFSNPPSPPTLVAATSRTSPHSYDPHDTATPTSVTLHLLDTPMVLEVEDDTVNGIHVRGGDAVPFLTGSGVDRRVLRGAWNLVDPDGVGTLTKRCQFLLILRLVALVQSGLLQFRNVEDDGDVSSALRNGLVDFDSVVDALAPPSFGAGTVVPTGASLVHNHEMERREHWRLVMEHRAANPTVPLPPQQRPQPFSTVQHQHPQQQQFGPQPPIDGGGWSGGGAQRSLGEDGGGSSFGGFGGGGGGPPAAAAGPPVSISDAFRDLIPDVDAPLPIDEFGDFEDAPADDADDAERGDGDGGDGEDEGGGVADAAAAPPSEWGGMEESTTAKPPLTTRATATTAGSSSASTRSLDEEDEDENEDNGETPRGDGGDGGGGVGVGEGASADDGVGIQTAGAVGVGELDFDFVGHGEVSSRGGGGGGGADVGEGGGDDDREEADDDDFGDFEDAAEGGADGDSSSADVAPPPGTTAADWDATDGSGGDGDGDNDDETPIPPCVPGDDECGDNPPSGGYGDGSSEAPMEMEGAGGMSSSMQPSTEDHLRRPMVMMDADGDRISKLSVFDELMGGTSEEMGPPKMMGMAMATTATNIGGADDAHDPPNVGGGDGDDNDNDAMLLFHDATHARDGMAGGAVVEDDDDDGDDFGEFEDADEGRGVSPAVVVAEDEDDDFGGFADGGGGAPPTPGDSDAVAHPPPPVDASADTFGSFADATADDGDVAATGAANGSVVVESGREVNGGFLHGNDGDDGGMVVPNMTSTSADEFGSFEDAAAAEEEETSSRPQVGESAIFQTQPNEIGGGPPDDDDELFGSFDDGGLGAPPPSPSKDATSPPPADDDETPGAHDKVWDAAVGIGIAEGRDDGSDTEVASRVMEGGGGNGVGTPGGEEITAATSFAPSAVDGGKKMAMLWSSSSGDGNGDAAAFIDPFEAIAPPPAAAPILTLGGVTDQPAAAAGSDGEEECAGARVEDVPSREPQDHSDAPPSQPKATGGGTEWTASDGLAEGDCAETPAAAAPAIDGNADDDGNDDEFGDFGDFEDAVETDADAPSAESPSLPETMPPPTCGFGATTGGTGTAPTTSDEGGGGGLHDIDLLGFADGENDWEGGASPAPDVAPSPAAVGQSRPVCNGGPGKAEGEDVDGAFFSDFRDFEEAAATAPNEGTEARPPSQPPTIRDDDDPPSETYNPGDTEDASKGGIDDRREQTANGTGSFFAAFEGQGEAKFVGAATGSDGEAPPPCGGGTTEVIAAATADFGDFGRAPIADDAPASSGERGTNGDVSFAAAFGSSNGAGKAAATTTGGDVAFSSRDDDDANKVDDEADFGDFDHADALGKGEQTAPGESASKASNGGGDRHLICSPPSAEAAGEADDWGDFNDAGFDAASPKASCDAVHNPLRPDCPDETTPVSNGAGDSNAIQAGSVPAAGNHMSMSAVLGTNGWHKDRIMNCPTSELADALLLVELVDEGVSARKVHEIRLRIKSLSEEKARAAMEDRFEDAIELKRRISQLEGEIPDDDVVRRWRDILCGIADGSAEGDDILSRLTLEHMRDEMAELVPRLPRELRLHYSEKQPSTSNGNGIYASGSLLSIFEERVLMCGPEKSSGRSLGEQGKVDPNGARERQMRATRCLSLCRMLGTGHSMHGAHWKRVVAATNAKLSMATALFRDMNNLSSMDKDMVRRSKKIRVFLNGLHECVRVVRYIAATVADLYCLDDETDLTGGASFPWNGIDAIAEGGRTEALWAGVLDLATEFGVDASLVDVETVPQIRRKTMSLLLTTGSSKEVALEVCRLTLHPLISSSWTLSNGTKLGNPDTRSKVDFEGKVFMACAANLWANMVCSKGP